MSLEVFESFLSSLTHLIPSCRCQNTFCIFSSYIRSFIMIPGVVLHPRPQASGLSYFHTGKVWRFDPTSLHCPLQANLSAPPQGKHCLRNVMMTFVYLKNPNQMKCYQNIAEKWWKRSNVYIIYSALWKPSYSLNLFSYFHIASTNWNFMWQN